GWMFEVVFDYGEHEPDAPGPAEAPGRTWHCRHDPFSSYRAGFEVRTYRLCQRILLFHHFGGEPGVGRDCLVRSLDLTYRGDPQRGQRVASFLATVTQTGYVRRGNGYLRRSLPPLELAYAELPSPAGLEVTEAAPEEAAHLPEGLNGADSQWIDLDGEGL